MISTKIVRFLTLLPLGLVVASGPSFAEDTTGKWQFGFGLSFYSTTDIIRSNADIALTGEVVDESGLPSVRYVDERPDDNLLNQPSVSDDFKFDFNVSYGVTRWLAVELATSYLKAPVGDFEFYSEDQTKPITSTGKANPDGLAICGADLGQTCFNYETSSEFKTTTNSFVSVGDLTEIPLMLSGLVRFRPESPFDPYIGLGVGYIFTDLQTGDDFQARAEQVSKLTVGAISRGQITDATPPPDPRGTGFTPGPLAAEVHDAFEWHAVGGVDYYVNERFSFFVDARYVWTDGAVEIRTDGAPQVRIAVPDKGTLLLFQEGEIASPFDRCDGPDSQCLLWEDLGVRRNLFTGVIGNSVFQASCASDPHAYDEATGTVGGPIEYNCQNSGYLETEDKNFNGLLDFGEDVNFNGRLDDGEDANENGILDTEDNGVIYVLPPGTRDPNERFDDMTFYCPNCDNNAKVIRFGTFPSPCDPERQVCDGSMAHPQKPQILLNLDTEDVNFNGMLDRFLSFGVDVCTDPDLVDQFPECQDRNPPESTAVRKHIWPEGCTTSIPQVGSFNTPEGCPPPTGKTAATTGADNVADVFIVQGGDIKLGGFSLGVGFKFTF